MLGKYDKKIRHKDEKTLKKFKYRLSELSDMVEKTGAKMVLIGDIPKVCPDKLNYLSIIVRKGDVEKCETAKSVSLGDRQVMNNVLREITSSNKNISYIDPHDELCQGNICKTIYKNGLLKYSDTSPHFRIENRTLLTNFWKKFLITKKL